MALARGPRYADRDGFFFIPEYSVKILIELFFANAKWALLATLSHRSILLVLLDN